MTVYIDKSFGDLDKFPVCAESNCAQRLEIQNRFKCTKCSLVFCCEHRIDFKHKCPSLKIEPKKIFTKEVLPKCTEPGCNCKLTTINKFVCAGCGKNYCMTHRLDFVHKCVKSQ